MDKFFIFKIIENFLFKNDHLNNKNDYLIKINTITCVFHDIEKLREKQR